MLKAVRSHVTPAVQDVGVKVKGRETHGPTAPSTDQGPGSVSDPRDTTSTRSRQPRRPVVQNAGIPPIAFPGGRNPYLDRPLPLPPRPKNTSSNSASTAVAVAVPVTIVPPIMPARPSTSSGPSSKSTAGTRPYFDKRQSRDDMALNTAPKGKGLQPYIIGIKGPGPLTPESSPGKMRAPSPAPNFSVPSRVMTPESSHSGEIPIGMALGSPSQFVSPYVGSWNGPSQNVGYQARVEVDVQRSPSPPPVQKTSEPTVQRTKTQKRRLFGALFGRKPAEPAKTMVTAEANQSTMSITVTGPAEESLPTRSKTVSGKKAPKHKPIVIRSNTLKETASQQDLRRTEEQLNSLQPLLGSAPSKAPMLLDLEIPDVRLERYSIMFSGVLNSNGTTSPQSKSSLLERRQATLKKLKSINDQEEEERIRPRRATSPQPMKSPGFTLFPQAMSSTNSLAPPPRRIMRSNTSPALLPSPARATFDRKQEGSPKQSAKKERKMAKIVSPRAMDELNRAAQVEKLREQQQATDQAQRSQLQPPPTTTMATGSTSNGFYFGPNNSALILESPASFVTTSSLADEDYEPQSARAAVAPLRPVVPEPEWQMISPPSSTTSSASEASSKQSITSSVTTRPSLDTLRSLDQKTKVPPVEEDDVALKAAVEISIARQISISRQQRNMLRPLGQGTTMSSSAKSVAIKGRSATVGSGSQITVEVVKRKVQETKLAVPTVVNNGDTRRSELVEVVGP